MFDVNNIPHLRGILSTRSLRAILESKDLAQLGDFLANFIYTTVRIGSKGTSGSIHVWDNSLRDAMEIAGLRSKLGKKTKPGRVADAAEAYIVYAVLKGQMSLEEMVVFLSQRLNHEDFEIPKIEKQACATAFGELLGEINKRIKMVELLDFQA